LTGGGLGHLNISSTYGGGQTFGDFHNTGNNLNLEANNKKDSMRILRTVKKCGMKSKNSLQSTRGAQATNLQRDIAGNSTN
jgi:hypothetical protein